MSLQDCNLLIAQNSGDFPENLKGELEEFFTTCHYVKSKEECEEKFKEERIDLAVILLDELESQGPDIIKYLKSEIKELPVLGVSAKDGDDLDKALNHAKVDGVAPAPLDFEQVKTRFAPLEERIDKLRQSRIAIAREEANAKPTNIPERSLSVEESIEHYFKKTLNELTTFDGMARVKKIDFSVMKTFLYTAYNNFKDIDPAFEDDQLKTAKANLEFATKMQNDLNKRMGYAIEAHYENIFLKQQIPYMELYNRAEDIKKKMEDTRTELGILTAQMTDLKEKMKTIPKKSEAYMQVTQDVKRMNGKHTDRVHNLREMMDEIGEVTEEKDEFWKAHIETFKDQFSERGDQIKEDVKDVLDVLAYKFDKQLWVRAKKSRNIREFFAQSRVHGLFSSKTYLEYYVNNLDIKIVSEHNKKLIRYLNEINTKNKIPVAIISSDFDEVAFFRDVIEKIDTCIKTVGYSSPQALMKAHPDQNFEVIIANFRMGKMNALQFFESFKKKYPDDSSEIAFCIIFPKNAPKQLYAKAVSLGVSNFIDQDITRENLIEVMKGVL